jgi:hypothetical protein
MSRQSPILTILAAAVATDDRADAMFMVGSARLAASTRAIAPNQSRMSRSKNAFTAKAQWRKDRKEKREDQ